MPILDNISSRSVLSYLYWLSYVFRFSYKNLVISLSSFAISIRRSNVPKALSTTWPLFWRACFWAFIIWPINYYMCWATYVVQNGMTGIIDYQIKIPCYPCFQTKTQVGFQSGTLLVMIQNVTYAKTTLNFGYLKNSSMAVIIAGSFTFTPSFTNFILTISNNTGRSTLPRMIWMWRWLTSGSRSGIPTSHHPIT